MVTGSTPRYLAEQAVTGFWTVIDRETNRPALVKGYMQLGMEKQEAQDLATRLSFETGSKVGSSHPQPKT